MILILHIAIALAGVALASVSVIKPRQSLIQTTYAATFLTIFSGTILVVQSGAPMLKSCLTGIGYVMLTLGLTAFARHRLANEYISTRK